jgi:hypothetical protein
LLKGKAVWPVTLCRMARRKKYMHASWSQLVLPVFTMNFSEFNIGIWARTQSSRASSQLPRHPHSVIHAISNSKEGNGNTLVNKVWSYLTRVDQHVSKLSVNTQPFSE